MRRRIVAAILANTPRALLPWSDTSRLRAVAREVCSTSCEKVAVVGNLGAALRGLPVALIPDLEEGKSAAIRGAVDWALRCGAEGLLLVDGDQAHLDRNHLDSMLRAFRETRVPVSSYVDNDLAMPAVFGVETFARLARLTGDHDARQVLKAAPIVKVIPWPEEWIDRAIDDAIDIVLDDLVERALEANATPIPISEEVAMRVVLDP